MDDELQALVRRSVMQALTVAPDDIGPALDEFGWNDLVTTDESFAFTTLFEAQGYLAADTDARGGGAAPQPLGSSPMPERLSPYRVTTRKFRRSVR